MNAIIIDDMPLAIANLKADLEEHCPDIQVVGEANGVVTGLKLLKTKEIDLLFLDIDLQDGEGFDILELLPEYTFQVIFTTASNDHAIRAFQVSALDYLLKPIDPTLLVNAVSKAKQNHPISKGQYQVLQDRLSETPASNKIALHTQDQILISDIDDIIRCEANGNYTLFYFKSKSKLLVTKTLKDFEKVLSSYNFLRTHQSHLINLDRVLSYVKTEGGYILMDDESRVPVSVRKKSEVMETLGKL